MKPIQIANRTVRNKPLSPARNKGIKNKVFAPRLKVIAPSVHQLIFGEGMKFPNQAALNRHNLRQRFLGELVQQNQFESILDANPATRFCHHSSPEFTTRRYDIDPATMLYSRHDPDDSSVDRLIVSASAKSRLTEQGHLQPVGKLPAEVWTDDFPVELANLVCAHINEKNKVKESISVNNKLTDEELVKLKTELTVQAEAKLQTGSPLTSTTAGSLIDKHLKTWGPTDEHIEVDAHKTNIVSPSYLAALILFAAKDDELRKPAKNDWRTSYPEKMAPDAKKMKELLIQHGIEPDGKWTKRERTAYFGLVASEHMLIGATPANVARVVNTKKD